MEIDRAMAAGVRFGCVLADAGYGSSALFRQGLTARKLVWAVGIPRHLKVYPADVQMIWPVAKRGRPRQRHVPATLSMPAEDMLSKAKWRTISWRRGTKGKLKARFAAVRVRLQTDHRSGSGTKVSNICLGRRLGSSANTGCPEKRNTISPACRRRPTCAP